MDERSIARVGDGEIGGKARGFLELMRAVEGMIARYDGRAYEGLVAFPETRIVTTSVFRAFLAHNGLEPAARAVEAGRDDGVEDLRTAILRGVFPAAIRDVLASQVPLGDMPLAVRSSSLLEDQKRASFAGKYASVFVVGRGDTEARLDQFLDAIKVVYASAFGPDALAYRHNRGLRQEREEMAVLVQEVVGLPFKRFWLPAVAGVGFSQNGYCWNSDMKKKDGLVRLVFGLGTRAVGRGYVRLFSPARPLVRPEGTEVDNIQKCSQKTVDVIDLDHGTLASVHFRELIADGFNCYPGAQAMVSLRDGNYIYRPVSHLWDASHAPLLTMDGVLGGLWMGLDLPKMLGWLLRGLETSLGFPVDMEFAVQVDPSARSARIHLLQARPLAEGTAADQRSIPALRDEDVLIRAARSLPTAFVPDIEYLVYVDEEMYHGWPYRERQSVARTVGRITEALRGKRFALIGPGRWGSWNPLLGVPVTYAEIAGTAMLIEVARRRATYTPEVSYGSHFFQDLIEDHVAYLPLYPDEPNETLDQAFLRSRSVLAELLPDPAYRRYDSLIHVVHVPSATDGRKAHAILSGEAERAVVFLAERAPT
jgi:hypothetical protein